MFFLFLIGGNNLKGVQYFWIISSDINIVRTNTDNKSVGMVVLHRYVLYVCISLIDLIRQARHRL